MIQTLSAADLARQHEGLCELLWDAVDSGASVGFLPPLTLAEASQYWQYVTESVACGGHVVLGAFEGEELVGSVQLELFSKPNASHRAEVQKLLVMSKARRRGLGARLMAAIEEEARSLGRTLLVLDTRKGDPSDSLYRKVGYTVAGEIPGFARSASGELHATVLFYKQL